MSEALAGASAVVILETPDSFLVEKRPNIPGKLANSGLMGLFGGHIEEGQEPYDAIRAELYQELGLELIGPIQFIEETEVNSQNKAGEPVRRIVNLFSLGLDPEVHPLKMKVSGDIVEIPKSVEGVESFKNNLTTYAYNALLYAVHKIASKETPTCGEQESKESEPTSEEVASALVRIGRGYNLGVDLATIEEIAVLPLDEAIGAAYTQLLEWGLDPDEELPNQGILET